MSTIRSSGAITFAMIFACVFVALCAVKWSNEPAGHILVRFKCTAPSLPGYTDRIELFINNNY